MDGIEWTYSFYRASLKRHGKPFAIVSPDGRNALSFDDAKILLDALNAEKVPAGVKDMPASAYTDPQA